MKNVWAKQWAARALGLAAAGAVAAALSGCMGGKLNIGGQSVDPGEMVVNAFLSEVLGNGEYHFANQIASEPEADKALKALGGNVGQIAALVNHGVGYLQKAAAENERAQTGKAQEVEIAELPKDAGGAIKVVEQGAAYLKDFEGISAPLTRQAKIYMATASEVLPKLAVRDTELVNLTRNLAQYVKQNKGWAMQKANSLKSLKDVFSAVQVQVASIPPVVDGIRRYSKEYESVMNSPEVKQAVADAEADGENTALAMNDDDF